MVIIKDDHHYSERCKKDLKLSRLRGFPCPTLTPFTKHVHHLWWSSSWWRRWWWWWPWWWWWSWPSIFNIWKPRGWSCHVNVIIFIVIILHFHVSIIIIKIKTFSKKKNPRIARVAVNPSHTASSCCLSLWLSCWWPPGDYGDDDGDDDDEDAADDDDNNKDKLSPHCVTMMQGWRRCQCEALLLRENAESVKTLLQ